MILFRVCVFQSCTSKPDFVDIDSLVDANSLADAQYNVTLGGILNALSFLLLRGARQFFFQ